MKKDIHPAYQDILFVDSSTGTKFVCGSTLQPKAKETFNGVEYPVCHVSVSSSSHPFFTGSQQFVDTEGRVKKFEKRYARPATPVNPVQGTNESKKESISQAKALIKKPSEKKAPPKVADAPKAKPGTKAKDAPKASSKPTSPKGTA